MSRMIPALYRGGAPVSLYRRGALVSGGEPVVATALRQIAGRCAASHTGVAPASGTTGRTDGWVIPVYVAATAPRIVAQNLLPHPVTVAHSLEVAGTLRQFTFSGETSVTLPANSYVVSDPLVGVELAVGSAKGRTWVDAAGSNLPQQENVLVKSAGTQYGDGRADGVNYTTGGTLTVPAVASWNPGVPVGLAGIAPAAIRTVLAIGDSITQGSVGSGTPPQGATGFISQGLTAAGVPYSNLGLGGDSAGAFTNARADYWMAAPGHFTDLLFAYGTNDLRFSITLAEMQTRALRVWNHAVSKGLKVWACTVTPNEVNANEIPAWNAWLKDGAPLDGDTLAPVATGTSGALRSGATGHPLTGALDSAAPVTNGTAWVTGMKNDDLHPNPAGHDAMAPVIQAWAEGLN